MNGNQQAPNDLLSRSSGRGRGKIQGCIDFCPADFHVESNKVSCSCTHQYFCIPGLHLSSLVSRALLQFIVTKSVVSSSPETLLELVMRWDETELQEDQHTSLSRDPIGLCDSLAHKTFIVLGIHLCHATETLTLGYWGPRESPQKGLACFAVGMGCCCAIPWGWGCSTPWPGRPGHP